MRLPGLHKAYEVLTRCVRALIVGSRELLVRKHCRPAKHALGGTRRCDAWRPRRIVLVLSASYLLFQPEEQASLAGASFRSSAELQTNSSQAERMRSTYGIVGNRQIRRRLAILGSCASIESDLGLF